MFGRVFVIKASLLLSAVFSILFGLSDNIYSAILWRFFLGLSNGMMGPIKVLVTEYNKGDEKREAEMMGAVIGMWGLGFLFNPAIAGFLSDPVKQYPESHLVKGFGPFLSAFPFALPNVTGCIFCLAASILVHNFVEETLHPRQNFTHFLRTKMMVRRVAPWSWFKQDIHEDCGAGGIVSSEVTPLSREEGNRDFGNASAEQAATMSSLWERDATRENLLSYWFFPFLIVCIEELIPLFCLSRASGLGLQEKDIGKIFTGCGFFYVVFQYVLLNGLVRNLGLYKTQLIGVSASVPLCALIPLALITNGQAPEGALALPTLMLLGVVYGITQVFSSLVISTLAMTTNRTVMVKDRGSTQGLSTLGGSIAKGIAPVFSGFFFSSSVQYITPPFGSVVVFSFVSLLGTCLAVKMSRLHQYENAVATN